MLDPENTGMIPEGTQNLVVDSATKEAVLLNELKAFMDEKKDRHQYFASQQMSLWFLIQGLIWFYRAYSDFYLSTQDKDLSPNC